MKNSSILSALMAIVMGTGLFSVAREPTFEDGWTMVTDEATGIHFHTMELTLHAQAEPKPALKYRLIPDDFDLLEGNAALYYLKAMGFFEQSYAQERLHEFQKAARAKVDPKKWNSGEVAPYSYLHTSPYELPIEEVKEYLGFSSFQPPLLEEARRLRSFSLDRNIRQVDSPIQYLLPEIQAMRELARTQSIRCRLAIAQGRVDDAVTILGQQAALANHLASDEFYVCGLVGAAVFGVSWGDALYLVQHPQAPNLYWAYATLPTSFLDMRRAHAFERQFLYEQVKVLREVDQTPRPAGYWQAFIDRLVPQLAGVDYGGFKLDSTDDAEMQRAAVVAFVAASYPGAKRFLMDDGSIPQATIDAYPTAQVVFLAVKMFYDRTRDEFFKWNFLPISSAGRAVRQLDGQLQSDMARLGWSGQIAKEFLPGAGNVRRAEGRMRQCVALIQTIEAIRMYGAAHGNKLPNALNDLPVPAPHDPFANGPFSYESNGNSAVLSGRTAGQIQYRLILKFAPGNEPNRQGPTRK